jgi:hypothetical protein
MMNNAENPQLTIPRVIGCLSILVGCEESQAVCIELRKLGHEAYSCDLQECSGGHSEWHLQMDIFEAIKLKEWDAAIFFPTCTYLTVSANKWYKDQPPRKSGTLVGEERRNARIEAIKFFMNLYNCGIPKIAIENPIGVMSSEFRKPDQVLQPWMFGHGETKATCLWLKDLPLLQDTEWAEFTNYRCKCGNIFEAELGKYGCCDCAAKPLWQNQTKSGQNKLPPSKDRHILRAKTYPGIAKAMAMQWFS